MKTILELIKEQLQTKIAEGWTLFPAPAARSSLDSVPTNTTLVICDFLAPESQKLLENLMQKWGAQNWQFAPDLFPKAPPTPSSFFTLQERVKTILYPAFLDLKPEKILCFGEQARLALYVMATGAQLTFHVPVLTDWLWTDCTTGACENSIVFGLPTLQNLVLNPGWRRPVWECLTS